MHQAKKEHVLFVHQTQNQQSYVCDSFVGEPLAAMRDNTWPSNFVTGPDGFGLVFFLLSVGSNTARQDCC